MSLAIFIYLFIYLFFYFFCAQQASACNTDTTQTQTHQISNTTNREQNGRRGNSTAKSQAPDDGYINVRNTLST